MKQVFSERFFLKLFDQKIIKTKVVWNNIKNQEEEEEERTPELLYSKKPRHQYSKVEIIKLVKIHWLHQTKTQHQKTSNKQNKTKQNKFGYSSEIG